MPDKYDKLGWALEIASRGFFIHPLQPESKRPQQGVLWKNIRTTDPARIRAWFTENPQINYAVSPGSGGLIIDADQNKVKKDGRVTDGVTRLTALEAEQDIEHIILGRTFTVESPSTGIHLYLLTEEPVTNHSGFPTDIDVRGESGYVVGPGCYYNGKDKEGDKPGHYTVIDSADFLPAPPWVVQRCRADILNTGPKNDLIELDLPSNISQAQTYLTKRLPAIEGMDGGGDFHTYTTACALCHGFALSQETALDLAANYKFHLPTDPEGYLGSWNDRCEPPWDVYGPGDTLEVKIRNGDRYAKQRRGEMSGAVMLQGLSIEVVAQAEAAALQAVEEGDEKRRRLIDHLLRGKSIFDRIKPVRWIIPFWLPGAGITGIVGESGVGKSTVLLDLALTLAHDMEWHENATRTGYTVVYTCGEDYEGAVLQIRAWCRAKNIATPNENRFIFMPEVPPLANIEEVNLWIDVLKEKVGNRDVAVFIDTWQRATCGLSQNEEREMQGAINSAEAIGRNVRGPVIVAFHSPKSNRDTIAGWEGQRNTANALWYLEKDARGVKLEARKVRCAPTANTVIIEYVEYETGLRDDYFGFSLKHVVPKRLGGHRITADGAAYREDNLAEVSRAVAEVLYAMESARADDTNSKKQYTIRHAAERIVGSPNHNTFGKPPLVDDESPWAREQVATLKAASIRVPMELEKMEELIKTVLNPSGYQFADGRRVWLREIGNKPHIFAALNSGLTSA